MANRFKLDVFNAPARSSTFHKFGQDLPTIIEKNVIKRQNLSFMFLRIKQGSAGFSIAPFETDKTFNIAVSHFVWNILTKPL